MKKLKYTLYSIYVLCQATGKDENIKKQVFGQIVMGHHLVHKLLIQQFLWCSV